MKSSTAETMNTDAVRYLAEALNVRSSDRSYIFAVVANCADEIDALKAKLTAAVDDAEIAWAVVKELGEDVIADAVKIDALKARVAELEALVTEQQRVLDIHDDMALEADIYD